MRLRLRVVPRASRNAIEVREGVLHVRVTSPASEGRANAAAVRVLADALGVAPSAIEIESGARSRDKLMRVPDSAGVALRRLGLLLLLVVAACSPVPPTTPVPLASATPTAAASTAASAAAAATPANAPISLKVYAVPRGSRPHDVAPSPDGTVWYTAQATGELGQLNPATGETRHIKLGNGAAPHGVIVGPDGSPWITDGGLNAIVRVDQKSLAVRVFPLPADRRSANLNTAAFDKSGILWFTGQSGVYGRLDPASGEVRVFDAPRGQGPYGITSTPDGQVYFASLAGSYVGRIDTRTGTATVLEPPTPAQGARRVWSDSRGRIWVSEWNVGKVARYDPAANAWREWKLPGANPMTYAVFVDDRDIVWLTDWGANALVRFDPETETFASFPHNETNAFVRELLGRPGEVWGALSGQDRLVVARTR